MGILFLPNHPLSFKVSVLLQFNQSNIFDDLPFEKTSLTIRRNLDQQANLALKVNLGCCHYTCKLTQHF